MSLSLAMSQLWVFLARHRCTAMVLYKANNLFSKVDAFHQSGFESPPLLWVARTLRCANRRVCLPRSSVNRSSSLPRWYCTCVRILSSIKRPPAAVCFFWWRHHPFPFLSLAFVVAGMKSCGRLEASSSKDGITTNVTMLGWLVPRRRSWVWQCRHFSDCSSDRAWSCCSEEDP